MMVEFAHNLLDWFIVKGPLILWAGLLGSLLFATVHLLTMLITSWGDRRASSKSLLFSLLIHLCCALGVVVVTGAWSITPYKEALGAGYFAAVGSAMVGKLGLAFLLIIMATWVSFGIGHRLVRAHLGALPVTDVDLRRMAMRLRVGLWLTVVVALATLWVALGIHPPSLNG